LVWDEHRLTKIGSDEDEDEDEDDDGGGDGFATI
jgi:hypothetical protein